MGRIESIIGVASSNYEDFQILRYEEGQFYRAHHDCEFMLVSFQHPLILTDLHPLTGRSFNDSIYSSQLSPKQIYCIKRRDNAGLGF